MKVRDHASFYNFIICVRERPSRTITEIMAGVIDQFEFGEIKIYTISSAYPSICSDYVKSGIILLHRSRTIPFGLSEAG